METTFAVWLRQAGETPAAYARRTGHKYMMVRRLAGVASGDGSVGFLSDKLLPIAEETGIPLGVLIEEAHEAAHDPTPPRRYRRKERQHDVEAADRLSATAPGRRRTTGQANEPVSPDC